MQTVLSAICHEFSHTCQRASLGRFYSTNVTPYSRAKWNLPQSFAPPSLLDDHDEPVDLTEDNDLVNGVRPNTPPVHRRTPPGKPTPQEYASHRAALKKDFPEGWKPPRKLSRQAMDGLRELHHYDPQTFSTRVLSDRFKISPEAVRRILKSKWEPTLAQRTKLAERERQNLTEHIKLSRIKERIEAREIAESKGGQLGSAKSKGWKDRLTFE